MVTKTCFFCAHAAAKEPCAILKDEDNQSGRIGWCRLHKKDVKLQGSCARHEFPEQTEVVPDSPS